MIMANYPGHLVAIVIILALAAFLIWTHRGTELRKRYLTTTLLYGLNLLVALALLILIWDPSSLTGSKATTRNEVLVYVDTSESMSIVDDEMEASRLDRVAQHVAELFPTDDANRPALRLMGFDQVPYPSRATDTLTRWGNASNLAAAFSTAQRESERVNPETDTSAVTGVLFFTDGQADKKMLAAYPQLSEREIPVAVIGVGSSKNTHDMAITRLEAPLRTTVDGPYTIQLSLSGDLEEDAPAVQLEIIQNGTPAKRIDVAPRKLMGTTPITVELYANTIGTERIEARLSGLADEINQANNHREATLAVVEEPRLRTLLYTQWLSPDIGRVRSALARIQKVQLDTRIDARIIDESPYRSPKLAQPERPQFPDSAEALRDFDLVIIGPCDPNSFSTAQAEALLAFVSERGGGLLILPGAPGYDIGNAQDKTLRALFPAEVALYPEAKQGGGATPQFTSAGVRLGLVPADLFSLTIADLSPAYVALAKPAATTLAASGEEPVLCIQRIGRGYTALLNLRGLFQLYRANENGGPLRTLLSGLVTYLGTAPKIESQLELFAERDPTAAGQVRFHATVLDDAYTPLDNANVLLTLDSGAVRMDGAGNGSYDATMSVGARETIMATVEAARDGHYIGERTVALALPAVRGEMDVIDADHQFLEALAAHVGGEYHRLEDFPATWADALPATTTVSVAGKPASSWRTWTIFSLICLVLSVNWFTRRMLGLI